MTAPFPAPNDGPTTASSSSPTSGQPDEDRERPSARFIATLSVTDANRLGVSALTHDCQRGPIMLTRRDRACAVVVSWDLYRAIYPRLVELDRTEAALGSIAAHLEGVRHRA